MQYENRNCDRRNCIGKWNKHVKDGLSYNTDKIIFKLAHSICEEYTNILIHSFVNDKFSTNYKICNENVLFKFSKIMYISQTLYDNNSALSFHIHIK